jgi:hypothetical protein
VKIPRRSLETGMPDNSAPAVQVVMRKLPDGSVMSEADIVAKYGTLFPAEAIAALPVA